MTSMPGMARDVFIACKTAVAPPGRRLPRRRSPGRAGPASVVADHGAVPAQADDQPGAGLVVEPLPLPARHRRLRVEQWPQAAPEGPRGLRRAGRAPAPAVAKFGPDSIRPSPL